MSSRDILMSANKIYWFADLGSVANDEMGTGVCVDSNGNVYAAATQVISGVSSWVVTKYVDDGSIAWQKQITGTSSTVENTCHGIAVNGTYLYVTGIINNQTVVVRLSIDGSIVWQRYYASPLPPTPPYVPFIDQAVGKNTVAKSDGSVYFMYRGWSTALGYAGIFIFKFDASGTLLWQKIIPDVGGSPYLYGRPFGLVDTGDSSQGVYFGNAIISNDPFSPSSQNVIYNLEAAGVNFSSSTASRIGLKILYPGDCAGYYSAPSTYNAYTAFPATNQFSPVSNDVYVINYAGTIGSGGGYTWAVRTTDYPAPVSVVGCQTDQDNNLYVGATSDNKVYILKYNSSGVLQWQRSLSNPSGYSVSLDSLWADNDGSVYVCGFTTVVSQSSQKNIFVAKIPNDGSLTGTYDLGASPNGSIVYQASSLTVLTGQFLNQAVFSGTLASEANGSGASAASISASTLSSTVTII